MDREELRARARERAAACAQPVPKECTTWGCTVYIRQITLADALRLGQQQRADLEAASAAEAAGGSADRPEVVARMLANRICDAENVLIFDPDTPADVAEVLAQPAGFIVEMRRHIEAVDAGNAPAPTTSS